MALFVRRSTMQFLVFINIPIQLNQCRFVCVRPNTARSDESVNSVLPELLKNRANNDNTFRHNLIQYQYNFNSSNSSAFMVKLCSAAGNLRSRTSSMYWPMAWVMVWPTVAYCLTNLGKNRSNRPTRS